MDPSQPAQPTTDAAYNVPGNPVEQNHAEHRHAESWDQANTADIVEARERGDVPLPSTHGGKGQGWGLGYGMRRADGDPGVPNTEAEQMRLAGEREVAAAQTGKTGFGEERDFARDLDRKKAEQAPAREAMREARRSGVDVGGALGQEGGPAVVEGR